MNRSDGLDDFCASNGPPASNPSGCKDFASRVDTDSSLIHARLMDDFGKLSTQKLIKNHALIDIVLDDDQPRVCFDNTGYSFEFLPGENLPHWVMRRVDQ